MVEQYSPIAISPIDETPKQETIKIDPGTPYTPVSDRTASNRASMAHYALNGSKTYDDLYKTIQAGQEDQSRQETASKLDWTKAQQMKDAIEYASTSTAGGFDPAKAQAIVNKFGKPTNPDSVWEEEFSKRYMNTFYEQTPGSWLEDALKIYPMEYQSIAEAMNTTVNKFLNAQRQEQTAQDTIGSMSWGSTIEHQLPFYAFPELYPSVWLRGNVGGFFSGGLMAPHLEEERKRLYNLPWDEHVKESNAIFYRLLKQNPYLAKEWAHAMGGQSISDQGMSIGQELIQLGTVQVPLVLKTVKAAKDLAQSVIRTPQHMAPRRAAADGIGDLDEAAILGATEDVIERIKGTSNSAAKSIEALQSILRPGSEHLAETPGRGGQEQVNRIQSQTERADVNFLNIVGNVDKVTINPAMLSTEDGVRLIAANTPKQYPGLSNHVLNATFHPIDDYDQVTNTFNVHIHLGDVGAKYFEAEGQAFKFAEEAGLTLGRERVSLDAPNYTQWRQMLRQQGWSDREIQAKTGIHNSIEWTDAAAKSDHLPATEGYAVKSQGKGYYIDYNVPLPFTADWMRDGITSTRYGRTPVKGAIKSFLSKWYTPVETMSQEEIIQRRTATHSPGYLQKVMSWDNLNKLNKSERFDLSRVIEAADTYHDPNTGKPGYFIRAPGELEQFWQQTLHYIPSEKQTDAFFEYARNMRYHRALAALSKYKNKLNMGAQEYRFSYLDKDGKLTWSTWMDGIRHDQFPGGENSIVFIGDKLGEEKVYRANSTPPAFRKRVEEGIRTGQHTAFRLPVPAEKPLEGWGNLGNTRAQWVVAKNVQVRPISIERQVPERAVAHYETENPHLVVQAKVHKEEVTKAGVADPDKTRFYMEGYNTVGVPETRAIGKDWVTHLTKVRDLIKAGKMDEARQYANANMRFSWDTVKSWFVPTKGADGKVRLPRLSLDEDFHVGEKGKIDVRHHLEAKYGNKYRDATKSDAVVVSPEFTQQRDVENLLQIGDEGSAGNPMYTYKPAVRVDPVQSAHRSFFRAANNFILEDMKRFSMEQWLEEASGGPDPRKSIFKAGITKQDVRYAPYYYFYNAESFLGPNQEASQQNRLQVLKGNHFKIRQFMGVQNEFTTFVNTLSQELSNSLYRIGGPKAQKIIPDWMLPSNKFLNDPWRYMRSIAVHAKLGLFHPGAYFTQSSAYVNIASIAGARYAPAAVSATVLQQTAHRINPGLIDHLDKMISSKSIPGFHGWKPGWYKEATEALIRSNFWDIGHEHVYYDDPFFAGKPIRNMGKKVVEAGATPFKEGAQFTRISAYYTAYLERRLGKGGVLGWTPQSAGKLTKRDFELIKQRAGLLDHNMSRTATSPIQTGALSIPTQFLSYRLRLFEMFFGKQLTGAEKTRLFLGTSAVWGIPFGGLGLLGVPVGEAMRRVAIDQGYIGDNWWSSMLMEGVMGTLGRELFGIAWDFGAKWGIGGFDQIRDLMYSDKSLLRVFVGAVGNMALNTYERSTGFTTAMGSLIRGDGKYNIKFDDVINLFKEINIVNEVDRLRMALLTTDWVTRTGGKLMTDVSKFNAIVSTIMGLTDQRILDGVQKESLRKEREERYKEYSHRYNEDLQKSFRAVENQDKGNAQDYFDRANAWLMMIPEEMWASVMAQALKGHESILEKIDENYYLRHVSPDAEKQKKAQETYWAIQEQKNRLQGH